MNLIFDNIQRMCVCVYRYRLISFSMANASFLNILSTNRVQSASQHGLLLPKKRYLSWTSQLKKQTQDHFTTIDVKHWPSCIQINQTYKLYQNQFQSTKWHRMNSIPVLFFSAQLLWPEVLSPLLLCPTVEWKT